MPMAGFSQSREFMVPEKLSARVNTEYEEMMPLVSPDGGTLYFARFFSPENTGGKYTGSDIWMSSYDANAGDWGKARNAGLFNSKDNSAVVGDKRERRDIVSASDNRLPKNHRYICFQTGRQRLGQARVFGYTGYRYRQVFRYLCIAGFRRYLSFDACNG